MSRMVSQPVLGVVTLLLALTGLALTWLASAGAFRPMPSFTAYLLAGSLTLAGLLAQLFPIHLRGHAKITMNSVPLLLMAVLLPPALAVTSALASLLVAELILRPGRGGFYSDVAAQVGRLTLVVLLASLMAHLPHYAGLAAHLPLITAALLLWAGDTLTSPVLLGPIAHDTPLRIIMMVVREGSHLELGQYLIGILGVVAAERAVWALAVLAAPIVLFYLTGKRCKGRQVAEAVS